MKSYKFALLLWVSLVFAGLVCRADSGTSAPTGQATSTPAAVYTDSQLKAMDSDNDGLSDYDETYIYHTDPQVRDTDGDGFSDGDEVKFGFDPNMTGEDRLTKEIDVDLKTQSLTYSLGPYQVGKMLISSGIKSMPTPTGEFTVLKKIPVVDYKGADYDFPHTRWNMLFKERAGGSYYIHGAYWHHNFGHPMSHGCVNVSYSDIEPLYNWADVGTLVVIK